MILSDDDDEDNEEDNAVYESMKHVRLSGRNLTVCTNCFAFYHKKCFEQMQFRHQHDHTFVPVCCHLRLPKSDEADSS